MYVENRRLHVALGWPHLAVASVILIVGLAVAFQIGRRSAQPPTPAPSDLSNILTNTPAPEAPKKEVAPPKPGQGRGAGPVATPLNPAAEPAPTVNPPPPRPTPAPAQPAPEPAKVAKSDEAFEFAGGSYYVVIQHFRTRDRERATAARDFLGTKGVACVIRPGGGDLELIATEAFASERQAQDLVRRLLEFGKEYRGAGGGYDFASAKARKF
jgi:type IV secretory pathway VirB10-like protein